MVLSIWTEYYDFFIILIGVIVGMFLAYFIFFRPRNIEDSNTTEYQNNLPEDFRKAMNDPNYEPKENLEELLEELAGDQADEVDPLDEIIEDLEDEQLPNDFEMGENSNIYESLEPVDSIDDLEDVVPALGIEILHEDDEENEEEVTEEEVVEPERIQIFGNYDLRPEIDPEQQIDDLIEDVLKLSEQTPAEVGGKYHVLYRKEDNLWYVKREGQGIVGDMLLTQHEAIAFATIQSLKNDTTIVVHDEEGRISKYKF